MISAPAVSDQSERGGIIGAVAAICLWSAGNVMVVETPMAGMQIAFWRILLGAVVYSFAVYANPEKIFPFWSSLPGQTGKTKWKAWRRALMTT